MKVLIVDDSQTNRGILDRLFSRWHMKPAMASSGEEALTALADAHTNGAPFELIITDMHMVPMDGFELATRIRTSLSATAPTIMMLTSSGQRGDKTRCQQLSISSYLVKPIRQAELLEAIARALFSSSTLGESLQSVGSVSPSLETTTSNTGPQQKASRPLDILVAEDNLVNQKVVKRLLQKRGDRVTIANDGQEALNALQSQAFDVVLMDVQMPGIDGFEAVRQIREREKLQGGHQYIIALTAHAMMGDRDRCLKSGMDDYLTKPIRPLELEKSLTTAAEWISAR